MENQNASAEYPHKTGGSSLQSATPVAAFRLCAALAAAAHSQKAPVKMGGVLFFKLQRFFCGKAAGFPLPPLNAGLRCRPLALRRGVSALRV